MKRSIAVWANNDWMNFSDKELKLQLIGNELGMFHNTKTNCYGDEPQKVKITIERNRRK